MRFGTTSNMRFSTLLAESGFGTLGMRYGQKMEQKKSEILSQGERTTNSAVSVLW